MWGYILIAMFSPLELIASPEMSAIRLVEASLGVYV